MHWVNQDKEEYHKVDFLTKIYPQRRALEVSLPKNARLLGKIL